jgi:hypothetical protein
MRVVDRSTPAPDLRIYQMTPDKVPFAGTVAVRERPSFDEV